MTNIETVEVVDEGLTLAIVKKRAISGVLALTSRNFILQGINLVSLAFFSALFAKEVFGVYYIVLAIRGFLSYFSDIGLAAALIQKKGSVTSEELKTTFLVQQLLVISLVIIGLTATPFLSSWQKITGPGVYLLWSFYIAFFLSSLKTIPSVLLERKLEFTRLIIPQILEAVVFNGLTIILALRGFGILSLAYSVLAQSLVGLITMYILQPWVPGFSFSVKSLRGLFKFGIPYQLNTFLAVVKDDGLTIFLGGLLGPAGIGLLLWAKKWGEAPLRFFMDQVIKVTFPAYARLQDNRQELESALSRSIFFISLLVFPSIVGLALVAPILLQIIERYKQWQPAILALGLFGAHAAFAAIATPLTNMLNATGRIRTTFKLMIAWVVLTWLLVPFFGARFGFNGAALGYLLVEAVSIVAIWLGYRAVHFNFFYSVAKPMLAAMIMGIFVRLATLIVPHNMLGVLILVPSGIAIYALLIFSLVGPSLAQDTRKVFNAILKR